MHEISRSRYRLLKWGDRVRHKVRAAVTWLGMLVTGVAMSRLEAGEEASASLRVWLSAQQTDTNNTFTGKLMLTADAVVQEQPLMSWVHVKSIPDPMCVPTWVF